MFQRVRLPWLNLLFPGFFQMLNDRIGTGMFFFLGFILLSPTIIGALLLYMVGLIHGFHLSSKLR